LEAVTIAVALVGAFLILQSRPLQGLLVYFGVLCWYAAWQPLTLFGVNLTAPRVLILILIFRCSQDRALMKRFRWTRADTLLLFLFAGELIAGSTHSALGPLIQNRAGAFFDLGLVYFAVRMTVTSKEDYLYLLKGLLVLAAPIAILGAFQSVTGWNPYGDLVKRGGAGAGVVTEWAQKSRRYGLYRADVNFMHPITFGFFFAVVGAICAGLWFSVRRSERAALACGLALAFVGLMSSMSSGPVLAGGFAILVMCVWRYRRRWKLIVALLIVALAAIDVASNRHWYDVLGSYLAFNARTASYRIGLMREALTTGMTDHWFAGYPLLGSAEEGEAVLSHWKHRDITNHYVFQLMRFGLLGLAPWIALAWLCLRRLRQAYRRARAKGDRWFLWCLGAAIAGALSSMFSAVWEGQAHNTFFAVLALAAAMPHIMARGIPAPAFFRREAERRAAAARHPRAPASGAETGRAEPPADSAGRPMERDDAKPN